jgi:hypothetical protein
MCKYKWLGGGAGMVGLESSGAFLGYEQTIFPGFGVGFGVEFIENEFIHVN